MANTIIRKIPSLTRVDNSRMEGDIEKLIVDKCKAKGERIVKDIEAKLKSKGLTIKSIGRSNDGLGAHFHIKFEGGMTYIRENTEPKVQVTYEGVSWKIPIDVRIYCDGYTPSVSIRCDIGFKGLNEIKHFIDYIERQK